MLNYIVTMTKSFAAHVTEISGITEYKYSHIFLQTVMLVSAYLCIEIFLYMSLLDGAGVQLQEDVLVLFTRIITVWCMYPGDATDTSSCFHADTSHHRREEFERKLAIHLLRRRDECYIFSMSTIILPRVGTYVSVSLECFATVHTPALGVVPSTST